MTSTTETRNVTLSLPKTVLQRVKIIAAQRDTSISSLLTEALERIVADEDRYERAKRRHLARLDAAPDLGTSGNVGISRDALHERP